ncbi:MAG: hypothetical protein NTY66_01945 [Candidatus Vogelbacteria bacterium]|nr:hypothetical protein [Candidatus Vogelbacteria bacterium]
MALLGPCFTAHDFIHSFLVSQKIDNVIIRHMTLRTQKIGHQKPWTLEELAAGLEEYRKNNSRYPTAPEVDRFPYLPSARSIERRFGGMIGLRQKLKLDSQSDFRSGKHSSERAHLINNRAHKTENIVYEFLIGKFGREFVHREYFFVDDKRTRADFFIYDKNGSFCVDVFYPANRRNLTGCLNHKLKKYRSDHMKKYPVIFLQMNEEIFQGTLDELVNHKQKTLNKDQHLMDWDTFKALCGSRDKLKVA